MSVRRLFLDTAINGANPGYISTVAEHLFCIALFDAAVK